MKELQRYSAPFVYPFDAFEDGDDVVYKSKDVRERIAELESPWTDVNEADFPDSDRFLISDGTAWFTTGDSYEEFRKIVTKILIIPPLPED